MVPGWGASSRSERPGGGPFARSRGDAWVWGAVVMAAICLRVDYGRGAAVPQRGLGAWASCVMGLVGWCCGEGGGVVGIA